MASQSKVYFFFDNTRITLKNRNRLKGFIESIFRKENKNLNSLNYILCSDKKLLEINRKYLSHNYFTDIITFDLSENKSLVTGEVYISVDRVRENAKFFGTSLKNELHRVIFHGALHLCGYDDKTDNGKKIMRKKEDQYLSLFSL